MRSYPVSSKRFMSEKLERVLRAFYTVSFTLKSPQPYNNPQHINAYDTLNLLFRKCSGIQNIGLFKFHIV